jgi:hypothetical protein
MEKSVEELRYNAMMRQRQSNTGTYVACIYAVLITGAGVGIYKLAHIVGNMIKSI